MSSSSDSPRRHTQHIFPEQSDTTKQLEVKRTSRYEIYGTATKPFGESYRRSLILQQDKEVDLDQDSGHDQEREESQLDADSVEETMGCSASRTEVALNQETVKGNFLNTEEKNLKPIKNEITSKHQRLDEPDIIKEIEKEKHSKNNGPSELQSNKLSDFEIIYGTDSKNNNNSGYSITDIYSEVKKSDKHLHKESKQTHQSHEQTQREKLMREIRERKDDIKVAKEIEHSIITKVEQNKEESNSKHKYKKDEENVAISDKNQDEKIINTVVTSAPVSFVEEEYSYEPEKNEATSKLVVRSRSMHNLDQNQFNYNTTLSCTLKRPNTLKMTTKPDGTIRYGVRQSSSESNLLDDDNDETPSQGGDIKTNYVSSIKNAFDAAVIESQSQNKPGKAEAFDGLRQYFHDNKHGLQELLINNNVVIIEPFRHEPPRSPSEKSDSGSFRTCRITGATIKSPDNEQNKILIPSNTLPRRNMKSSQNTRQGFYHPIKVNKELIDTELPDPEKVKTARELFEQVVKSRPISEIPSKNPSRPFFNTITSKMKITPEVKVIQGGKQIINEKKRHSRISIEKQVMKDDFKRYPIQRRWTDSGSLSSGVSSDFSCDQDFEFHQNEGSNSGSNQEVLEEYSTDEEDLEYNYPYDDDERHPVSSEVLQKIRACGTTVTYYGGKVISRSHGQYRSPMTMTIMDEIRQSGGTSEGRKKFESDSEEPYLGVKFRLVKSHSCGSRLEIAGTEEECNSKLISPRHESFRGKSIAEEVIELKEEELPAEENEEGSQILSLEEEEDKAEADQYVTNVEVNSAKNPQVMTWAELKLKEARKQWHCAPEAVRIPSQDMEFETFEVMDDSKPHKTDKNETGRG